MLRNIWVKKLLLLFLSQHEILQKDYFKLFYCNFLFVGVSSQDPGNMFQREMARSNFIGLLVVEICPIIIWTFLNF